VEGRRRVEGRRVVEGRRRAKGRRGKITSLIAKKGMCHRK
jgi:hypothetical protein